MREDLKPGCFGYRRKRNISLLNNAVDEGEVATGIDWTRSSDESVYYEEELEEYNNEELIEGYEEATEEEHIEPMMIGKKPINLDKLKVKSNQQEMEKITIYLDKNLITILKMLKKDKRISSYSQLIKEALQEYLT
ncbi:ribbon-helix-helix protein, CopG family [Clostridium sp. P21]|uniref:Ribbon-helix-helix protein, CopG family n=1 Tax=Clostridium muellerianum TaxID=2716538 RepID=A0A7Y0EKH4_9CLOT|nr:ribbon-helix-helix protein, CopG family [Clostridium muellerianum]NMM65135.1 ribbon-helix-helix protein, CopG family [Clostridium muellerianum]